MAISPITAPLEACDVSTQAESRTRTRAGGTCPPSEAAVGMGGGTRACPQTRAALLDLHCGCPEPERGPGILGS